MSAMSMQIHCPGCGSRLMVPANAGGRPARCPTCKTRFRVPDPRSMLDDTVTCWLDLDHIHEDEDREEIVEQMKARAQAAEQALDAPADSQPTQSLPQPGAEHDGDSIEAIDAAIEAALPADEPFDGEEPDAEAQPVEAPASADSDQRQQTDEQPQEPEATQDQPPSPTHTQGAGSFVVDGAIPSQQSPSAAPTAAAPSASASVNPEALLHVVDTGTYGVRFRFAAHCLDNPNFRASMPMRGMVSGETDIDQLIARPLAWLDKGTGHFTNTGEIETRYEVHPRHQQSTREIAAAMTTIEELPPPLNQPMPYFVHRDHASKVKVHSETFATPSGVKCEVTIPSLRYALDWLGRVNGVCGEDYAQLEAQTLKFEAQAWRAIPVNVRHRLAVWFDFQGDEQFLGYFNDSDFSKSDAGLAGLIITTRRMVWCKYHHHGAMGFDVDGTIQAQVDGRFADLYLVAGDARRRMVRLRLDDARTLAKIVDGLEDAPAMDFETASPPPTGEQGDPSDVSIEQ